MSHTSSSDLLALHGVRILGYATPGEVADRFRLDSDVVRETLLDAEAYGWARRTEFAGRSGWSLTERGRAENERQLAGELEATGARPVVEAAYDAFLPLNERLTTACTHWQIRPQPWDALASNDHTDWPWDERVLRTVTSLGRELRRIGDSLTAKLTRFDGYSSRFDDALARVNRGAHAWLDAPDRPSCHIVWIQVHEDFVATLGISRDAVQENS